MTFVVVKTFGVASLIFFCFVSQVFSSQVHLVYYSDLATNIHLQKTMMTHSATNNC